MQDHDNDETTIEKPGQPTPPQLGYAKPPEAHQFKKGKSGNLRGRPKGAQGKRKIAEKVLDRAAARDHFEDSNAPPVPAALPV